MVKRFQKGMSNAERAAQAWTILVGKAANRQTITYGELSDLMDYGSNHLGGVLGYLKDYCTAYDLPRLPYLVVNKREGKPGGTQETSFEELEAIFSDKLV